MGSGWRDWKPGGHEGLWSVGALLSESTDIQNCHRGNVKQLVI